MKIKTNFSLLASLLAYSIIPGLTSCVSASKPTEEIETVTLCEVLAEPKRFDHKLLKISGTMYHGFEAFALSDDKCPRNEEIWLEYGGRRGSGTIFAGEPSAERVRDHSLVIEGLPTSMVYDYPFRKLDAFIRSKRSVHAAVTIEGRYFSGTPIAPGVYGGYGHLYMFTLLVVQRVDTLRSD